MLNEEVLERLIDERNALIARLEAAEREAAAWKRRCEEALTRLEREAAFRRQAGPFVFPLSATLQ